MDKAIERANAIIEEHPDIMINTNPSNRLYMVSELIKCMIIDEEDKTCREYLARALEKTEEALDELESAFEHHKIQFTTLEERWNRPEWAKFKKLSEEND